MAAPNRETFIPVKTTLPVSPLPSGEARGTIITQRLLIRPVQQSDLEAYHKLRTDPEIMKWTVQGRVDKDLEETRAKLDLFLPPNDVKMSNWAICLREGEGEMIGIGGCHIFPSSTFGWPELGYMIRREFWGGGLATEFLGAFVGYWAGLEREERIIFVDERTLGGGGEKEVEMEIPVVEEQILAITSEHNAKSQGVLRKNGFEEFTTWTGKEGDGSPVELPTWRYFPARKRENEST
ncbi:acyl-CoA N-acyltransferase [Naviculisporaceae sp. PSN 640]